MTTNYTFDENIISDLYKDAYGFRPKGNFWSAWAAFNGDQKQALWDDLCDTAERAAERERLEQERCADEFIRTVGTLRAAGAKDFDMAVRWLNEAHDTNGDEEYLEFLLNIPYGYIKKTRILNQESEELNIPTFMV
jgi:hypothetical protein